MTHLIAALLALTLTAASPQATPPPAVTVRIDRPTIIAFRRPFAEAEFAADYDLAEAVSDFEHYLPGIKSWCERAHVTFTLLDVRSFRVQRRGKVRTIRLKPGGLEFGFYLAAPNRAGRVFAEVLLDSDMVVVACPFFSAESLAPGACATPSQE